MVAWQNYIFFDKEDGFAGYIIIDIKDDNKDIYHYNYLYENVELHN